MPKVATLSATQRVEISAISFATNDHIGKKCKRANKGQY